MLAWHRHEMLFGFAAAIIAGFLLTAVQNWSGIPGLSGRALQGVFLLWLLGRVSWFMPLPGSLLVLVEGSFLPLVALSLARPVLQRRLRNNYPIVVLVLLIAACQWLTLAGWLHQDELWQRRGIFAGLWLVTAMMTVLGGRVIPFFTRRGLGYLDAAPARPWLDRACLLLGVAVPLAFATGLADTPQASLAVLFLPCSRCTRPDWCCGTTVACGAYRCCGRYTWPTPGSPWPAWAWRCGIAGWP